MRIRERDGKDFDVPVFDLDSEGSTNQDDAGLMVPDRVVDDAARVYPKVPLPVSLEVPIPHVHDDDDDELQTLLKPLRLFWKGMLRRPGVVNHCLALVSTCWTPSGSSTAVCWEQCRPRSYSNG